MGIYNPDIKEWVRIVHEAGGLCFYDHANFNGVMGKIRARELGFDACMFMLHKTFGAPKGGGGPAVGAYGCTEELAPFLPAPVVVEDGDGYRLDHGRPQSVGKVREFFGNVPQVLKAYAWAAGHGRRRHRTRPPTSRCSPTTTWRRGCSQIRGVTRSHPEHRRRRMEMTRWSLGQLKEETGVARVDVAEPHGRLRHRRLVDEPRAVGRAASPSRPRPARCGRKEDARLLDRGGRADLRGGRCDPEMVKTAPHKQAIAQIDGDGLRTTRALGDDVAGVQAQARGGAGAGGGIGRAAPRSGGAARRVGGSSRRACRRCPCFAGRQEHPDHGIMPACRGPRRRHVVRRGSAGRGLGVPGLLPRPGRRRRAAAAAR